MLWYGIPIPWYEIPLLCYKIPMLYYARAYAVKDMLDSTIKLYLPRKTSLWDSFSLAHITKHTQCSFNQVLSLPKRNVYENESDSDFYENKSEVLYE